LKYLQRQPRAYAWGSLINNERSPIEPFITKD